MKIARISRITKKWLAVLLVLALLPCVGMVGAAADVNQREEDSSSYPSTPEGVVEAFVKAALGDVSITNEKMRLCDEILRVQYKYLPNREDEEANHKAHVIDLGEPWGPLLDKYHGTLGFEINDVKKNKNRATVKVLYRRLGWIWIYPLNNKECRSLSTKDEHEPKLPGSLDVTIEIPNKQKGSVRDNGGCRFLHITHDSQEVSYDLAKPGKFWRIISSYEPHISVSSAIKLLECTVRKVPGVVRSYPSKEQELEIRKDISLLENDASK